MNPEAAAAPPDRTVHVVMPEGVHDPSAPSGGNAYDRRVCRDLPRIGWQVHEHLAGGGWPRPGISGRAELARILRRPEDGSLVLLDGLVACAAPDIVVPEAERLRLAVLVHLPLGDETGLDPGSATILDLGERRTLRAAAAVVATSTWAAGRLVDHHGLLPERVHVAAPGADVAPLAHGSGDVPRLLCVAAVIPRKGQQRLVESLAALSDLPWSCVCVGGLDRDPGYAARLRGLIAECDLADRVHLAGPRTGARLSASYAAADLLVLPSSAETYGMVATEALARGVPVVASAVGGLPEAVGAAPGGSVPGALVPPGDRAALTAALRRWLCEPGEQDRARAAARDRRLALAGWETTARSLAGALDRLRQEPRRQP